MARTGYSGKSVEATRAIAEGDLVTLHCHQRWLGHGDYAGMDIFRFDDEGRVSEHWDVLRVVPESAAQNNGTL